MAKLIYAVMALALGALVAGFFVDSSNTPLIASIVLSAGVMLLILFGWSRRIRKGLDFEDKEEDAVAFAEIEPHGVSEAEDDADEEDADDVFRPVRERVRTKAAAADQTSVLAPEPRPAARTRKPAAKKSAAKRPPAKKPTAKKPAARKPAAKKPAAKRKPAKSTESSGARVLVIPGRSRYHRAGCRFAKGDDLREVSEATARRRGYEPCNVCGG